MPLLTPLARRLLPLSVLVLLFAGLPAAARAAPQALALVMTDVPVPVSCEGGVCRAVLTSFCLERERDTPAAGTAYRLAAGELTLVVRAGDSVRRLLAGNLVRLAADRGSHAVVARLAHAVAPAWDGADLFLEVGRRVTLLPAAAEGAEASDPSRLAALTGPLRAIGEQAVDLADPEVDVVRLLGRAVSRLPAVGRGGIAQSEAVWRESVRPLSGGAGRALAEDAYRTCRRKAEGGLYYSFRNCLVVAHDRLMARLNARYWAAVAGS